MPLGVQGHDINDRSNRRHFNPCYSSVHQETAYRCPVINANVPVPSSPSGYFRRRLTRSQRKAWKPLRGERGVFALFTGRGCCGGWSAPAARAGKARPRCLELPGTGRQARRHLYQLRKPALRPHGTSVQGMQRGVVRSLRVKQGRDADWVRGQAYRERRETRGRLSVKGEAMADQKRPRTQHYRDTPFWNARVGISQTLGRARPYAASQTSSSRKWR